MGVPLFFILGRPRSGTTLLKTLFDAHPNVVIPPELPVIPSVYQEFRSVRNWDRASILRFVDYIFQSWTMNNRKLENLRIDREKFTAYVLALEGNCTLPDLVTALNMHAVSIFPKEEVRLVGDKNPVYSAYAGLLSRIFPESRFVCIIRDYRDTFVSLRSLTNVHMEAPSVSLQAMRWRLVTKRFLKLQKQFPDRCRVIRYEDLVDFPEDIYRELCDFTGIPYDPGVFNFYLKKDEFEAAFPDPVVRQIHRSLMHPVNDSRVGLWKSKMSDREIRTADLLAGHVADRMGYVRRHRGNRAWAVLCNLPMVCYAWLLFALMRLAVRMPFRVNRWVAMNLPRLARIYHRIRGNKQAPDQPNQ